MANLAGHTVFGRDNMLTCVTVLLLDVDECTVVANMDGSTVANMDDYCCCKHG